MTEEIASLITGVTVNIANYSKATYSKATYSAIVAQALDLFRE